MLLKDYIKQLQHLEKKHGNLPLIFSSDDEGNSFAHVKFLPGVMMTTKDKFEKQYIYDFYNEEDIDSNESDYTQKCICIN